MLYADLYLLKPALIGAEQLIGLQSELSPDEYRHWHEIRQPGRQREYLLGRILLRRLLAERLGCPPDALVFRTSEHGKPTLISHDWQFNLSHSGDWLVLALCQQGPLGVDVEMGLRRRPVLPLAQRFYAPEEYQWLLALPSREQASAFYRLWSRKEAVLKAQGAGIAAGLDKVRFVPEEGWRLDNRLDTRRYQVLDWHVGSGWLSLAAPTRQINGYLLDERLKSTPLDPMLIHTIFRESAS
ncbi:4'-phosphopantetheinyl transferase family protein [Aeromonas media]|uniref:4'-phosphopantetheinyl transferase family protein n=1 Tax=Aeromonas media TaxID=651 RepID=UPI001924D627|nr:4'-phosphopantetheinyl transferase superfamily protein [Aeromonas media]MBL0513453.1 4'-phosphopantetheinyl transferase superfamily protein [Aeromonas media]